MAITNTYNFIGFGAIAITKPYNFTVLRAIAITNLYKFIGRSSTFNKRSENVQNIFRLRRLDPDHRRLPARKLY